MLAQSDFRVDTGQAEVATVILTGPQAVELLIIELCQKVTAGWVFPNPILKRLLHLFLLGLGDGGFFPIDDGGTLAVRSLHIVENADVLQIEGLLQDLVAVYTLGTIGAVRFDIATVIGFALNIPLAGVLREMDFDVVPAVVGGIKEIVHELLVDLRRYPA